MNGLGSNDHIPAPKIPAGCVNALLVFGAGGLAGLVLDLDHFLVAVRLNVQAGRTPLSLVELVENMQGRPLHQTALVGIGIVLCATFALYTGHVLLAVVGSRRGG